MLDILAWCLFAAGAFGCGYLWYACHALERFLVRPPPLAPHRVPVTVLKPLSGEDPALHENLRSFCRQDYPVFQVVFGVAAASDPAASAAKAVIAEIPSLDATLVVESARHGANLKIANLQNMLPSARHDLLVIADSDMRVEPDYLATVTAPFNQPRDSRRPVGLVTCLYRGLSSGGLWSDLACMHINHGFLPQAVVAASLGLGAGCFGATIVITRRTLEAVGLGALANKLADDHALGRAVRRIGFSVELSSYLVDDIVAEPSLAALYRHELRWARTIRLVARLGFVGSIVTYPVPLVLIGAVLGGAPRAVGLTMLLLALLVRAATARRIDRALGLDHPPFWLLLVRDLLSFGVFIASFFGRKIAWRDHKFRVGPDGELTEIEASSAPSL